MLTNTIDLSEIRKQLFAGGIQEIARLAGSSSSAVTQVFQGKYENPEIMEAIIEVANKHRSRRLKLTEALNKLTDK